jgi:CheY-like chemotaxis protein
MSLRRKEILVVDDSETNLLLLQAVLEDEGYHVVVMDDTNKAVEYIHKNKPDLILLDLLMPDMDGFDFMQQLGNGSGNFASPVIVVTAYANSENNRKARELGALDVINKPINISTFITKINKIVN